MRMRRVREMLQHSSCKLLVSLGTSSGWRREDSLIESDPAHDCREARAPPQWIEFSFAQRVAGGEIGVQRGRSLEIGQGSCGVTKGEMEAVCVSRPVVA